MFQTVLFIKLLLVHCATQTKIEANCSENVSLKCPDIDFKDLNFLSVTWYKIHNQKKNGIIRTGKWGESTQYYNFSRTASFGEEYSLLMPSVTPEDSGSYECAISANVGGQNLNLGVDLMVRVCDTQDQVTSVSTVLNTNKSTTLHRKEDTDLPVVWIVFGFVAVGFTKVILCLIGIWVIRSSRRRRSTRQWQNIW